MKLINSRTIKKLINKKFLFAACILSAVILIVCIAVNSSQKPLENEKNDKVGVSQKTRLEDKITSKDSAQSDIEDEGIHYTEDDIVVFSPDKAFSYCLSPRCRYDAKSDSVQYTINFANGIPTSDDDNIYLFEVATYEDETDEENVILSRRPVAKARKDKSVMLTFGYNERFLFSRFVPAILYEGRYVAIYNGQYILNPGDLSSNKREYLEIPSKKGLLLDANTLGTDKLTDLNVSRMVFNVPLSLIIGETEDETYPTIDFEYDGKVYNFNGYRVMLYDSLFGYLTDQGYHNTAIVLNDWNVNNPELIHPKARRKTGKSMYYALNTEEEDGVRLMEAAALFLADRYSGGEHGMVYDWVIANEVNQQTIWNYMATDDLDYYVDSFEKSFRTFYNAIKASYADSKVYYSIDHDWNDNGGNNRRFFNGRDFIYKFNECAKNGGNYDWGLSIHPYPQPLTKVRFWEGTFDKTENARLLTPMNLSTLTDVMTKSEFLDTKGRARDIAMTEIGFSSKSGEKLQAEAFAYSYYIMDNNEYINSYLMNRQTDDLESLKSGLALGIYNNDYSPKYIAEVFKYIDTPDRGKYLDEMLNTIGADSLEEALSWAQ